MTTWVITGPRGEPIVFVIMDWSFVEKRIKRPTSIPTQLPQPLRPTAHIAFRSAVNYPKARLQRGLGGPGERIQTMDNRYTLRRPITVDLKRIPICVHGVYHYSHQKQ